MNKRAGKTRILQKFMDSSDLLRVFLCVHVGIDTETKLKYFLNKKQSTVHYFLDQLTRENLIVKEPLRTWKDPRQKEHYSKRRFKYISNCSKIVGMTMSSNPNLRKHFYDSPEYKELIKFLEEKCDRYLKIIFLNMFIIDKIKGLTLGDVINEFIRYIFINNVGSNTNKHAQQFLSLNFQFGCMPFIDEYYSENEKNAYEDTLKILDEWYKKS